MGGDCVADVHLGGFSTNKHRLKKDQKYVYQEHQHQMPWSNTDLVLNMDGSIFCLHDPSLNKQKTRWSQSYTT